MTALRHCPACTSAAIDVFHEQLRVPVHSCLLHADPEEAAGYPRGDIALALCHSCGFIFNAVFDPTVQDYSTSYEETQAFSPRFRAFATNLAQRWVDRFDLRGKHVVEIGCGKAQFLATLCQLGGNRGTGIDPSAIPDRLDAGDADITLIQDFYSDRYAGLGGDAIVCRHTLEHIQPVGDFLTGIRNTLSADTGTPVLFELPDVLRVLREVAFWDIYYEHCSYFTAGSLARLFRASDFEVLGLSMEFDDQYLVLEAKPGRQSEVRLPIEDDVAVIETAVRHFRADYPGKVDSWRKSLHEACSSGRPAVVWGSGSKGVAYLTSLGLTDEVDCVVDINPYRQGMFMAGTGHPIVAPDALRSRQPDVVVAMNPIYLGEIRAELDRLEVDADLIAV